jgi:hypothetical protein
MKNKFTSNLTIYLFSKYMRITHERENRQNNWTKSYLAFEEI